MGHGGDVVAQRGPQRSVTPYRFCRNAFWELVSEGKTATAVSTLDDSAKGSFFGDFSGDLIRMLEVFKTFSDSFVRSFLS